MGIREQFQDKAKELAERAGAAAQEQQEQQGEGSQRAAQISERAKERARTAFDQPYEEASER
ncbi:hypothetical protein ACIBEA_24430 [Streptomyces sp. NPDC051555]|uniref:hypothetical protein n=1 Tax=Streptomyces sp. NPDC051555 TaxID=3365657 RepID=UPI00378A8825